MRKPATLIKALTAVVLLEISSPLIFAASTDTWVGGSSNNFSTTANWSYSAGSGPLASGDSLIFGSAGSTTPNNDETAFYFSNITFNNTAQAYTVGGNGLTLNGTLADNASVNETISFGITLGSVGGALIQNTVSGHTLALGSLTHTAGNGGTVNFTTTGPISTTTTDNNGMIGGWAVIDNGNNTYSWAHSGSSGANNITAAATTTTASSTANWAPTTVQTIGTTTVNSLFEVADIKVNSGTTLTIGSGGMIFQGANFWLQPNSGSASVNSGLASGELFVHTPNAGNTDTRITLNVVNNGSTPGILVKNGPGYLKLTGANTYMGNTIVNGGTLVGASAGAIGGGAVQVNAGALLTLDTTVNTTINGNFSGAGTVTVQNTISGNYSDTFNGDWSGFTGTLNYNTASRTVNFFAPASMDLSHATVNFANSGNNTSSSFRTSSTGTTKFGSLSGFGYLFDDGATEIGNLGANTTFSGVISQAGSITKVGSGTLILSGANTYNGATTVSGGALLAANTSGSATSTNTVTVVNANSTLGGSGIISGVVTLNVGTVLSPGTNASTGLTLTCGSDVTFSGAKAVFDLSSVASSGNDQVAVTGTLTIGSADTITINPITASTLDTNSDYTLFSAASVGGSGIPALNWGSSTPALAANFSILKNASSVVLHFTPPGVPPTVGITLLSPTNIVYVGATVTASASVSSSGTGLTYQWQSSPDDSTWTSIGGATSATYHPSTASAGTTYYQLVVTDSNGTGTGTGAALVVNSQTAPVITGPTLTPDSIVTGSSVIVNAAATYDNGGSEITSYQWQRSPDSVTYTNIPGATNISYSLTNTDVQLTDGGYFQVQAVNGIGTTISSSAYLSVSSGMSMVDLGPVVPTPGTNDIYQLTTNLDVGAPDGVNYYVDNANAPGQTFTTGNNPNGYTLNELFIEVGSAGTFNGGETGYTLNLYSMSGTTATLLTTFNNANTTPGLPAKLDWIRFGGDIATTLSPNTTYAYTVSRSGAGWWHPGVASGNPYSGGEIVLIPAAGGTVTASSTHNYDASFLVGLTRVPIPLTITTNPSPVSVLPGGSGSFSVTAWTDFGTITGYQWYKGVSGDTSSPLANGNDGTGTIFSGATTATLSFTSAATAENGNDYWCQVTSSESGGTTANCTAALLTVHIPANLVWLASPAGFNWDHNSLDWSGGTGVFSDSDNVIFNGTGSGGTVTMTETELPGSVTFSNATYTLDASGGKLSGATGLTKTSNGTLTILATANDYTGVTTVSGGTLSIGSIANGGATSPIGAATSASTNLVLNGGTLQYTGPNANTDRGATLGGNGGTIEITTSGTTLDAGGTFTGTGSLTKIGSGNLTLNAVNTFGGGTVVSNGTISLGSASAIGSGTLALVGGTVNNNASINVTNAITVNGATVVYAKNGSGDWVLSGAITGSGTFSDNVAAQNQTLNINGDLSGFTGTLEYADANNTYNNFNIGGTTPGSMNASQAKFSLSGGASLARALRIAGTGATAFQLGDLSGTGGSIYVGSGNTLVVGSLGLTSTYAGTIGDNGGSAALTKVGTGMLTLSGANTYTGATTVSNGTLLVNGQITSSVAVNGGTFGGTGSVNGSVAVNSGGTLAPGAGTIGALTVNGNLTLSGNTVIKLDKSLSPSNDVVNVSGALAYGGTLTVSNLGPALVAGDSFRIFPTGGTGSPTVSGNPGSGLLFSFTGGVLSVVNAGPSGPGAITNSISGNSLNLAWPAGQGWRLESQTNSLNSGLSATGWGSVSGTADGSYNVTIDPANPTVFYRLVYP